MRVSTRSSLSFLLLSSLVLGLSSCGSDDDDNVTPSTTNPTGGGGGGLTLSGAPGITGTFNGTAFSYTGSGVSQVNTVDANLAMAPNTSSAEYGVVFIPLANPTTLIQVVVGSAYWNTSTSEPSNTIYQALFNPGPRTFTADGVNGVRVMWAENGVEWASDYGSADQTGSSFTIQEVQDVTSDFPKTKVKATFTCKVYNQAGQVRTLSNCVFVGTFSSAG